MLYVNLTLRNIKRSIKEYGIFLMTMMIAMMLLYAFFAVAFSEEINVLFSHSEMIRTSFMGVSVLIVIVMGWLVSYISNFILRKRSKEFGMYLLSGMRQKEVTRMFVVEQFCIGLLALFIGCFLGVFMFQLLQAIIMNIFSSDYVFSISLSSKAFFATSLCFFAIYIVELIREGWILKKLKIRDLLYSNSQNETVTKKRKLAFLYVFLGIICMIVGFKLSYDVVCSFGDKNARGASELMLGIGLVVFSIYFFFFGLSGFLQGFFDRFKRVKYHKNTMVLYGRVHGRLRSNRIVLATLSMLILMTLSLLSFGMKFKQTTDMTVETNFPFDVQGLSDNESYIQSISDFFNKKKIALRSVTYRIYETRDLKLKVEETFKNAFEETFFRSDHYSTARYIKYSDYKALCKLKQQEVPQLNKYEYAINTPDKQRSCLEKHAKKHSFKIDGQELKLKFTDTIKIGQGFYYIVVPDHLMKIKETETSMIHFAGMSDAYLNPELESEMYVKTDNNSTYNSYVSVVELRSSYIQQSLTSFVSIVFSLFYISFIFICISATILAVQQMSDSSQQKYEYRLLSNMGLSKQELRRMLRKQTLLYFMIPIIVPAIYIAPTLIILDKIFEQTVAMTSISVYFWICLPLFFIVYLAYYALTYFSCKHTIEL